MQVTYEIFTVAMGPLEKQPCTLAPIRHDENESECHEPLFIFKLLQLSHASANEATSTGPRVG